MYPSGKDEEKITNTDCMILILRKPKYTKKLSELKWI